MVHSLLYDLFLQQEQISLTAPSQQLLMLVPQIQQSTVQEQRLILLSIQQTILHVVQLMLREIQDHKPSQLLFLMLSSLPSPFQEI